MTADALQKVRRRIGRAVNAATADRNRIDDQHLRVVLASVLGKGDIGIDVGAHTGEILGEMMRVAPAGRHIAFEPLPEMAANLRRAFPEADVRALALSDSRAESSFVHVLGAPAYSGLRRRDYPGNLGARVEKITVATAPLDDEIGDHEPALIKIDVEGGELQVLQGAMETLQRFKPTVWFEHGRGGADRYGTAAADVWDLLRTVGLRVYDSDARGPLSRGEFEESFALGKVWNYLAHP